MNKKTKIVLFAVIGVVVVGLLIFGVGKVMTGKATSKYYCAWTWPQGITYSGSLYEKCPNSHKYCNRNSVLAGVPRCCNRRTASVTNYATQCINIEPACTNHAQCSQACPGSTCAKGVYGCCTGKDIGQCNLATGKCYCSANNPACRGTPPPPAPGDCTDTDGGKVYGVKGIITNSTGTHPDICYKDSYGPSGWAGEKLAEGSCDEVGHRSLYDCADEGKICQNGACVAVGGSCNDTDGGLNFAARGTVEMANGSMLTDFCIGGGNVVHEYYCNASNPNAPRAFSFSCTGIGTCQNGTCVIPGGTGGNVSGCTDSDGGLNYAIGGTVISSNGTTRTDYGCYGTGRAHTGEWMCNASAPKVPAYFAINCAYYGLACVGNACV